MCQFLVGNYLGKSQFTACMQGHYMLKVCDGVCMSHVVVVIYSAKFCDGIYRLKDNIHGLNATFT